MKDAARKVVAQNRKARHDYHILDTLEAGIALTGTEVKSIKNGRINLVDSYARIDNEEAFLFSMHVSPYEEGGRFNHEPTRTRKLLLHKAQIRKISDRIQSKGFTLIPLSVYIIKGKIKIELGVAKGKKEFDKRDDLAERDARREMERAMRGRGNPK